jgi:hypothetical protein
VDNLHDDSGTWRQVVPYALEAGRRLKTSHGTWEWHKVVKTFGSARAHKTIVLYEFVLNDGGGVSVSLGYYEKQSLPTGKPWHGAFMGRLSTRNISVNHVILPATNRYWLLTYQASLHPAWFGVFFKVGGHLAVAGQESGTGVIASTADFSAKYGIAIETGRVGPGLGGSAGIAVGILTGFPSALAMKGKRSEGWDFGLALAENWGSYLNLFNDGGKYAELAQLLHKLGPMMKMTDNAKQISSQIENLGGLADIYKVYQAGDSAIGGAGETATQSDAQTINLFDIPTAGKGIELSLHKTWSEITRVEPIS